MSTIVTITPIIAATTASTMAATSSAQRRRREEEYDRCTTVVHDEVLVTVEDKQDYAHCVGIVHPPVSDVSGEVAAAVVLTAILVVVGFMWWITS